MIFRSPTRLLAAGIVLAGGFAFGGPAFAACPDRAAVLSRLLGGQDIAAAERAVDEIAAARECTPAERRMARRALAERLMAEARRLQESPSDAGRAEAMIDKAAALRAFWAAAMADGDLKLKRRAFAPAALAYQQAIDMIAADATDAGRLDVPRATLARLAARADEARHLAASGPGGQLVVVAQDRNGQMGGVFSQVLNRGAEAVRIPVPILFVYNSDEFTPVGREAATEFARLLQERQPGVVSVTGHTDRVGGEEFNQALSLRRARRVAEFLRASGFAGEIRVAGKGKTEPRQLSDATSYDQAQIDELNRRVEFDWKS